jgi:putative redox protein
MAGDLKIQIRQISATAAEAEIGEHRVTIDRPLAKGGSNQGPMGGELFLAAVGGCFMSNLLAAIRAREAAVRSVHLEVTGAIADSPARFSAVELAVTAESSNREELDRLIEIADRGCIMMNTLRGRVEVTIRIAAPV